MKEYVFWILKRMSKDKSVLFEVDDKYVVFDVLTAAYRDHIEDGDIDPDERFVVIEERFWYDRKPGCTVEYKTEQEIANYSGQELIDHCDS